jgi:hypothetical protein
VSRTLTRLVGRRVRIIRCADRYSPRPHGLEGKVIAVDDVGTVHVLWDDGSRLGLVPGDDLWEVLP